MSVTTFPRDGRPRRRLSLAAGVAAVGLVLALGGCGSSSKSTAVRLNGTTVQQDCQNVADTLSDGPDPDADSVGYAEAQVLPLRQLHIAADPTLARRVTVLADAYEAFVRASSTDASEAAVRVTAAENAVNVACPKAAP